MDIAGASMGRSGQAFLFDKGQTLDFEQFVCRVMRVLTGKEGVQLSGPAKDGRLEASSTDMFRCRVRLL